MTFKITIDDEATGITTQYLFRRSGSWRYIHINESIVACDRIPESYDAALNSIANKIKDLSENLHEDK